MSVAGGEQTRRVRPWIAALLTFVGWGVGLYYARQTRAALWWAIGGVVVGLMLGAAVVAYMLSTNSLPPIISGPDSPIVSIVQLALTLLVAIGVWISAARHRSVKRGSPLRLLGYAGIWLLPLALSLSLALGVRFFWMQPFRIPSAAMTPTVQAGDYVIVSKARYGYGPYSTAPLTGLIHRQVGAPTPARGDLVVFRPPSEPDRDFIKRVVGLPGDRVQMIRGVLNINGVPVRLDPLDRGFTDPRTLAFAKMYRETLPNGVSYTILDMGPGDLDDTREFEVPPTQYFVMGDNRDISDDSRRSVGFVPIENIVGRVDRIISGGHAPADE